MWNKSKKNYLSKEGYYKVYKVTSCDNCVYNIKDRLHLHYGKCARSLRYVNKIRYKKCNMQYISILRNRIKHKDRKKNRIFNCILCSNIKFCINAIGCCYKIRKTPRHMNGL